MSGLLPKHGAARMPANWPTRNCIAATRKWSGFTTGCTRTSRMKWNGGWHWTLILEKRRKRGTRQLRQERNLCSKMNPINHKPRRGDILMPLLTGS